uniref:HD domain-containing protein n=1 Tax=Dictyoglomus thermophilum TaxID=14 RepID=A0A7C3RM04_DICTH
MKDDLEFEFSVLITDLHGKILNCNKSFEELSGYSKEELKGVDIEEVLKKDNLLTKNGNKVTIHYHVFPIVKEDLSVYVLYDVKKLKEIYEENLMIFQEAPVPIIELDIENLMVYFDTLRRIVGENLEAYFNTYPEAIFEFIHKIKLVRMNNVFEKEYVGFSFENFKENFFNYFTAQNLDIVKREIIKFYKGDKKLDFELEAYDPSYGIRDLRCIISIFEEKKAVAYIVDVTEQKHLQKELKNSVSKLERYSQQIIKTLSSIIEHKDPYTANHQRRVAELSKRIAQEMGFSKEKINAIYIGALLHDIGKIAIPTEILNKPGKLTPIEFEIVKTHPFKGYDILKNIDFPPEVLDIVYHHHERLDGTGYPDGLKNGDISLEVGIISVSDVVDAMSSHRPYRPPLGIDTALSEIEKWKGIKYYEEVVDICIRLFREKGFNLS